MKKIQYTFLLIILLMSVSTWARQPEKNITNEAPKTSKLKPRASCDPATKQYDLEINNVRARLLNGGDVWWDLNAGRYVIPKVVPGSGKKEVSSLFAGAVWVGGYTPAGALKMMAQTYRSATRNDCWPGPIDDKIFTTTEKDCRDWDNFFVVKGKNVTNHIKHWKEAQAAGLDKIDEGLITEDLLFYPGRGNARFESRYKFELPDLRQGLGSFYEDPTSGHKNGRYEPEYGEYPDINIRGCKSGIYGDEMAFWIYNDEGAGGIHTNSGGDPIRMEVQVQAFAFQTGDQINDMSFYRYKLINRASEDIQDCYFAVWTDPDLGCFSDDYVGCFPKEELMFIYNIDATDGSNGCNCGTVNTYCNDVPVLGIDYFRGPLGPKVFDRDSIGTIKKDNNGNPILLEPIPGTGQLDTFVEIGMSSFMYYNGLGLVGNPPPGTTDPTNSNQYYNYLVGRWADGDPLTKGGVGKNPGSTNTTRYAFPDEPNNSTGWSMCTASAGEGDRRTLQASGPMLLTPGAVNELIVGVVWVADQVYPCPSLNELLEADVLAQDLFDNCFELKNGPDAPNVDFVELDKELILLINPDKGSNNFNTVPEDYSEAGLGIPPGQDSLFRFEGYRIFQVSGPDVSLNENTISDPTQVREIATVDLKNNIKKLYNWVATPNPTPGHPKDKVFYPVEKVAGTDVGIKHSFKITEDQFALSSRTLVNHKKYYFIAIAYGYNNYKSFDIDNQDGQRMQYCPGRRNIGPEGDGKPYIAIPRPQVYEELNSKYGDGVEITRLDGVGLGHNFVRLKSDMYDKLLDGSYKGSITYQAGSGPFEVKVINPLQVKNGRFELKYIDANPKNNKLDLPVTWKLTNLDNPADSIKSDVDINKINEQLIPKYGISISISQTEECGKNPTVDNGIIGDGLEYEYKNPDGPRWYIAQPDNDQFVNNFIQTQLPSQLYYLDPQQLFSNLGDGDLNGTWYPYRMTKDSVIVSPAWNNPRNETFRGTNRLDSLNNVDIVFTSDKSKWSRCIVIETWNPYERGSNVEPFTGRKNFDVKTNPSVDKYDKDGDGYADPDNSNTTGFGWFPGYAVDVETGQRVNIFFGENSYYGNDLPDCLKDKKGVGNDMMWNPTDQVFNNAGDGCDVQSPLAIVLGGHHYIYVTRTPYDSCKAIKTQINASAIATQKRAFEVLTWCSMAALYPGTSLNALGSTETGLIPNDLVIRLRVDNPYNVHIGTGSNSGHGLYQFEIQGKEAKKISSAEEVSSALDNVNVVPNPYYGFSNYETGQYSNIVKITNLPAKCEINIFSIDGKFIKQYKRDEVPQKVVGSRGISEKQIYPDVEWDLTNFKGIPIASGAYLIHIKEGNTGEEKIVKWFGLARKFDPSGL